VTKASGRRIMNALRVRVQAEPEHPGYLTMSVMRQVRESDGSVTWEGPFPYRKLTLREALDVLEAHGVEVAGYYDQELPFDTD
jgi:hypothetical protein